VLKKGHLEKDGPVISTGVDPIRILIWLTVRSVKVAPTDDGSPISPPV